MLRGAPGAPGCQIEKVSEIFTHLAHQPGLAFRKLPVPPLGQCIKQFIFNEL